MAATDTVATGREVHNSDFFLKQLVAKLKEKPPEAQQRIVAHIREVSGHNSLPSYHNNGASEEDKIGCYKLLIYAVIKSDWSKLKGQVASGQAKAPEPAKPEPKAEPAKPPNVDWAGTPNPEPKPEPTPTPTPADPRVAAIAAAISAAFSQQPTAQVDEAQVRNIVTGLVNERLVDIQSRLTQHIQKADKTVGDMVKEYLANVPPRDVVEIRKWDGTITEIKERFHRQLPTILKMLTSRNAEGWPEFVWAWGAAGAGKTRLTVQLAKALGVKAYVFPCDESVTRGTLLGFNNIANGTFVKGWLYEPYKNGGLAALDEADLPMGSVLAGCNSIEGETFTFGNGEVVERHRDFYLICYANTKGTGATNGFKRNTLDAATLNRMSFVELKYDEELERDVFGNKKWAEYVQRVRAHCAKARSKRPCWRRWPPSSVSRQRSGANTTWRQSTPGLGSSSPPTTQMQ